jgi:hypothetical protein
MQGGGTAARILQGYLENRQRCRVEELAARTRRMNTVKEQIQKTQVSMDEACEDQDFEMASVLDEKIKALNLQLVVIGADGASVGKKSAGKTAADSTGGAEGSVAGDANPKSLGLERQPSSARARAAEEDAKAALDKAIAEEVDLLQAKLDQATEEQDFDTALEMHDEISDLIAGKGRRLEKLKEALQTSEGRKPTLSKGIKVGLSTESVAKC